MRAASLVALRWLSLKYAGTVITASRTGSPRNASASRLIFCRSNADSSSGVNSRARSVTLSRFPIRLLNADVVPLAFAAA
jgi:hypothetical protein